MFENFITYFSLMYIFLVSIKMTRYARAKGSKASNEKLPNEATPWHLMKQQLEENKNKNISETTKSTEKLVTDRKDSDIVKNYSYDWAEFDNKPENLKSKYYIKFTESSTNDNNNHNIKTDDTDDNHTEKLEKIKDKNIKRTDKDKVFKDKKQYNVKNDTYSESNDKEPSISEINKSSNCVVLSKRQKRNLKRKLEKSNNDESKKCKKDAPNKDSENKIKQKTLEETGGYKRKKPDTGVQTIIVNGVEIEIVKYDGFPVKKEDAERLGKLKQQLLMKGKGYIKLYNFFLYVLMVFQL